MFNFFSKFIRSSIFLPALFLRVLCSPTLFLSFTYTTFYAFALLIVDCAREYGSMGMGGSNAQGSASHDSRVSSVSLGVLCHFSDLLSDTIDLR